jgi:hypothetical protein
MKIRKMCLGSHNYNKRFINLVLLGLYGKVLICLRFICTDLAPSSLGLYENLRQILSRTDLALG